MGQQNPTDEVEHTEDNPIEHTWHRGPRAGTTRKTYYDPEADEVVIEQGEVEMKIPGHLAESPVNYEVIDTYTEGLGADASEQVGWARND